MYYLYTINSARVLHRVLYTEGPMTGQHIAHAAKSGMYDMALLLSKANIDKVYTIDSRGDLHNTRDGKPVDKDDLSATYSTFS